MQNAKCKIKNAKFILYYSTLKFYPKIVNDEIIFVRCEATNPQHSKPM